MAALIETLESRIHFSSQWPKGLIDDSRVLEPIFVNQSGFAKVAHQSFSTRDSIKTYLVYFDDPGSMTVQTIGAARTEIAIYTVDKNSGPLKVSSAATGSILTQEVDSKQPFYIAVRPKDRSSTGTFALEIHGVAHAVIRPLQLDSGRTFGRWITDISSTYDCDDFHFEAPSDGNWIVTIEPTGSRRGLGSLDATLLVYDRTGKPIAGTYTSPINAGGPGVAEQWIGPLKAGTRIYIRADGLGRSTGWYHIRVELSRLPVIIHGS